MENENKTIRVGIVNEAEPTGTAIIPDADCVFAVVHPKGADHKKVIFQGVTDTFTAGEVLLAALDVIKDIIADNADLGALVMAGLTGLAAKEKAKREEADNNGDDE